MATFYTEGIILQHTNWREADRILTVYTRDQGKLTVLARGVRKISSKLAGSLEPFTSVKLMLASGRSLPTVANAEVVHNFRKIKNDEQKIILASFFAGIIDRSSHGHQHDQRIYELINEVLSFIESNSGTGKARHIILWYAVWKYLAFLGYQPELADCLSCRRRIDGEPTFFHLLKGGLICGSCQQQIKEGRPISRNAIKVLRMMFDKSIATVGRLRIDGALDKELASLTGQYLNYIQEADFKLVQFFQS